MIMDGYIVLALAGVITVIGAISIYIKYMAGYYENTTREQSYETF